jgi:hypothetical protein
MLRRLFISLIAILLSGMAGGWPGLAPVGSASAQVGSGSGTNIVALLGGCSKSLQLSGEMSRVEIGFYYYGTPIWAGGVAFDGGNIVTGMLLRAGHLSACNISNVQITRNEGPSSVTAPTAALEFSYDYVGTTYNFVGSAGLGGASYSIVLAPATVPGAPTIGMATGGDAQASVSFTAPASNGGSPITGYTVTSSPGGFTGTGTASPIAVTGLTNGTAYTFKVTATNAVGTGAASAASNSVTPAAPTTVPGPPTIGTATGGNGQASVTFTAPASNGGSPITTYTVYAFDGTTDTAVATGTASPIVATGLVNGRRYTSLVGATNAVGAGSFSGFSNHVLVGTVPGEPTIGAATAGNGQASVAFTAPASNGGWPVTGYTVTSSPGGAVGHRHGLANCGSGPDQRYRLHVHGDRHQPDWHRCRFGALQQRDAGTARHRARCADDRHGDRGSRAGQRCLHGARLGRWLTDHQLYGRGEQR